MSELKVDTIVNLAGTGKPNLPVSPTLEGAAISAANTYAYTSSASEPSSPKNGHLWWDSSNEKVMVYINGEFKNIELNASTASALTSNGDRGFVVGEDNYIDTIQYWDITTVGNAADFGNLTSGTEDAGGTCSGTRAIVFFGTTGGSGYPTSYPPTIDYFATATTGNATDFGDSTTQGSRKNGLSDGTYGLCAGSAGALTGAASYAGNLDVIDYVTIDTTGNATDFGDLSEAKSGVVTTNDNTRGVFVGGVASSQVNTMEYVTIATTGNATDFGDDLTTNYMGSRGVMGDGTYGVWHNGYTGSAYYSNVIAYITIQTTGNATDFGDLSTTKRQCQSTSNATKGHIAGGRSTVTSGVTDIEEITIATPGNASDFADLNVGVYQSGGLSGAAS
jgi:hypothetical protein